MLYGRIDGVERQVSRLIQGTLLLGHLDEEQAWRLFDAAYASGCNAFDTALVYGAGRAERLLGSWARSRGVRDDLIIIDKGCHPADEVPRMTPADLAHDIERSLANLGTSHIDLYLLHRDDPMLPVDEIVTALAEQQRLGNIRAYGGSNWTHQRLQLACEYARRIGVPPFAASSPELSLVEPVRSWPGCISVGQDAEALAWYGSTRLPLLAWSPLASGFLSGHFRRGMASSQLSSSERRVLEFYASDANWARLERLCRFAEHMHIAPSQAALAYVMHVPAEIFAVLGCRTASEVESSISALKLRFTCAELADLSELPGA